ncbi:MAG: hypothetical protein A3G52_04330 [Candidatus Taylorbacteria bacterium RIFCSPLOWO2_12_FULL_43_20]|uniref:Peptidoglycan binding-like domain-containing protein n=1 Tax=Candidatus Taylorbacteria bacterium RIFCSPLOWO2_12_FULL_43_20 TaxID=1802332 RepID=A0A1G2NZY7_9BACT|nr:MAG: hypothetical protein A2825_01445 [Candidatus Taylorbacteria bacterium RIFCSPHIGHO2_01_FULL_43_120]OHA23844.1 MAG: hypothetical protein A3B98_04560 [Candidatus Taylorbacteria bacterium RIFCSPHIGHO2_02_FULL_43_55]OHA30476.1 MAG: hypothetical protein A3B09_03455 [Candidatus Taylorbacteria bacterium RIFCSPLOWO2_01_FULL_43_83]OHA38662.1 MAG: hypothetical protein A3H58_03460 [Candidatus Taylorbacteria bacterium RIFCSPLOWO2_02_FULL_43_22b]OHA41665.1 MAG: hypothetical protein A3G52_04330 [Candi
MKKIIAGFLGISMTLSLVGSVASSADAQMAGGATFTRDLTIGSTGDDVVALQSILVAGGYLTIPAGVAPGYFGGLTRAALAKWQAAMNISPAVGYFGPISRAAIGGTPAAPIATVPGCPAGALFNYLTGAPCTAAPAAPVAGCPAGAIYNYLTGGLCSATGTESPSPSPSTGLEGGAGSVDSYTLVSGLNNEKVGEGSNDVSVAGIDVEVDEGSDIMITAVKLTFNEGTAGSDFDKYADDVSIWVNGTEYARVDGDKFNSDNNWISTLSLDSGAIIKAGTTEDIVVKVSGISNLDSNDAADTWTVDFSSVRFQDAQGATISEDPGTATRTFSFETFATAVNAELKIVAEDKDVNDPHIIDIHATDDTDDVPVLSFTMEAKGSSDLKIEKLAASTTVTGATNVDALVKEITLWIEGKEIGSGTAIQDADGASVGTVEDYLFDDIDYTISAGDKVEAEIRVSFNSIADTGVTAGDTLQVDINEGQTDQSAFWSVKDETGERLLDADITGTVTGGAHAIYDIGLNLKFVSATAKTDGSAAGSATGDDTGIYTIVFDATSFGDDVFIDADVLATTSADTVTTGGDGILWATTTNSTATGGVGSTTVLTLLEAEGSESSSSTAPDVETAGSLSFGVPEGETRRFTLKVNIGPAGIDQQTGVRIRGINWDTDSGDAHANLYNFNLGNFKTETISLLQQT